VKAYLLITGILFALIGGMHLWSLVDRWPNERLFNGLLGTFAMTLAIWGFSLMRARPAR
jgi:NhaP-type Na+/H+ and K+/H+ antiporter